MLSFAIVVAIAVVVAANVIRDRNLVLQFLLFIPLWAVAAPAIVWDLLRRGRALPVRWLLLCLGLSTAMLSVGAMWSPALPAASIARTSDEPDETIRLLQWNVQWGGLTGEDSLGKIADEVLSRNPDVVLLSEAPPFEWFRFIFEKRSPMWPSAGIESKTANYWFGLRLLSRWPVRLVRNYPLDEGHAALFEIALPRRTLRVLMVDLDSRPWRRRSPSLRQVADIASQLMRDGAPADVIAGDFNTPGRFIGLDAIAAAGDGYDRASMWTGQWRGTWRSGFPIFDIDHVFVRRGIGIERAEIFTNRASDHRGQTADIFGE